ncbi:MAG: glycosyltransferase [Burkholderiaceae bacterium]|jgi:glycosyltransferase involved in cell wall biosynthesis|nr:glycosyltransferase [Burkholderiaceae bacterium]
MLSLVIPVYRNEASLPDLLAALQEMARALPEPLEVVFVVDGSPDRCYDILRERLPSSGLTSTLVLLTRNFGAFAAQPALRHDIQKNADRRDGVVHGLKQVRRS